MRSRQSSSGRSRRGYRELEAAHPLRARRRRRVRARRSALGFELTLLHLGSSELAADVERSRCERRGEHHPHIPKRLPNPIVTMRTTSGAIVGTVWRLRDWGAAATAEALREPCERDDGNATRARFPSPPCSDRSSSGRDDVRVLDDEDCVDAEVRTACPTGSRTPPLADGALRHRSRAGQRMPAVGDGARGSRCVDQTRPAPRGQRDSWDARSKEAPCGAGSHSRASSPRARDDRERTAGERARSSGVRGDAERSQESARLQRERQRGGRRRDQGRETSRPLPEARRVLRYARPDGRSGFGLASSTDTDGANASGRPFFVSPVRAERGSNGTRRGWAASTSASRDR